MEAASALDLTLGVVERVAMMDLLVIACLPELVPALHRHEVL